MIKKIQVTQSSMPSYDEYCEEIKDLWESKWLTNSGVKHKKLQCKLKEFLGVENVSLVTNGHMALELALQSLDLDGEVITTPFTFVSTTNAIVRSGLKPVFCDINATDFTIDINKMEQLITPKTVAILPVHVYGNVCDIEKIQEIANRHTLKVIYDAAHSFGIKYKGEGIGSFGDASCFSFHATKVFNTIEGGAVCYGNDVFTDKITKIRNFGISSPTEVEYIGTNAKMNEFSASMGLANLKYIDDDIEKRKCIVERYKENLTSLDGITFAKKQANVQSNYSYFPILIDQQLFGANRDFVATKLEEHGVYARKYFYPIVTEFKCYKQEFSGFDTPVAKEISEKVLTLPLYPKLSFEEIDFICDILKGIKKRRNI